MPYVSLTDIINLYNKYCIFISFSLSWFVLHYFSILLTITLYFIYFRTSYLPFSISSSWFSKSKYLSSSSKHSPLLPLHILSSLLYRCISYILTFLFSSHFSYLIYPLIFLILFSSIYCHIIEYIFICLSWNSSCPFIKLNSEHNFHLQSHIIALLNILIIYIYRLNIYIPNLILSLYLSHLITLLISSYHSTLSHLITLLISSYHSTYLTLSLYLSYLITLLISSYHSTYFILSLYLSYLFTILILSLIIFILVFTINQK